MIYRQKNPAPEGLPPSLTLSASHPDDPTQDKTCPRNSVKTQQRRLQVIYAGAYPKTDSSNYDNRYRYDDIKQALNALYHQKCAYCESRERRLQVEHYRPKSHYYWLAYSWDNLLLACAACNGLKKDDFEVTTRKTDCDITPHSAAFQQLHQLRGRYDEQEQPMLLNPENAQDAALFRHFVFGENGAMSSGQARCQYTIDTCGLNEERTLRLWRGQIVEKLRKRLHKIAFIATTDTELKIRTQAAIDAFVEQASDDDEVYLAFRQFVVTHFLTSLVAEVMNPSRQENE